MTLSRPLSPIAKGQLRCFQCRKGFPIKDGSWHHHFHQEVFLCKGCERVQRETSKKSPGLGGTGSVAV